MYIHEYTNLTPIHVHIHAHAHKRDTQMREHVPHTSVSCYRVSQKKIVFACMYTHIHLHLCITSHTRASYVLIHFDILTYIRTMAGFIGIAQHACRGGCGEVGWRRASEGKQSKLFQKSIPWCFSIAWCVSMVCVYGVCRYMGTHQKNSPLHL